MAHLLYKGNVGVFDCLFVLYRNPNCCTDWDEIWHGGGPRGGKVLGGFRPGTPTPWVRGA